MAQDRGSGAVRLCFQCCLLRLAGWSCFRASCPILTPWPVVGKYWPLILIFAGAGMFWDRSQRLRNPESPAAFPVGTTLGTVVFLLVLLALIWRGHTYASREWPSHSSMKSHRVESVDKKDANRAHVGEMPAGDLAMSGGAESLLNADFSFGSSWGASKIEYSFTTVPES